MSQSPDVVREKLKLYADGLDTTPPRPAVIEHFLALLNHYEDRVKALDALAKKGAAIAPATGPSGSALPTESICQEADRLVSCDRQEAYGHPFDDFMRTGAMVEAILGMAPGTVGPEEVGLIMIAVKISRQCNKPKRDNLTDIAGYAKCLDLIAERRAQLA